jgi:hypothetical protein
MRNTNICNTIITNCLTDQLILHPSSADGKTSRTDGKDAGEWGHFPSHQQLALQVTSCDRGPSVGWTHCLTQALRWTLGPHEPPSTDTEERDTCSVAPCAKQLTKEIIRYKPSVQKLQKTKLSRLLRNV